MPFWVSSQSSSLKIKLGTGIPLGKYGSGTIEEAAFAKTGFVFELSGERKFNDYIGIRASLLSNHNAIDNEEIFSKLSAINSSVRSVESGTYAVTSFLLGLVATVPTNSIFSVDLYGMVGYSAIIDPGSKIELRNFQTGAFNLIVAEKATAGSLCYDFGIDINFMVSKSVALVLGSSYYGAKGKFEDVTVTVIDNNNNTTTGTTNYENTVSILNFGLGIKILLWDLKETKIPRRGFINNLKI